MGRAEGKHKGHPRGQDVFEGKVGDILVKDMSYKRRILRESEQLLSVYSLDQIEGVALDVGVELWEVLSSVNDLQAQIMGKDFWTNDNGGRSLRGLSAQLARAISIEASSCREDDLSRKLIALAEAIDQYG